MNIYPIGLCIDDKKCVVIGGGKVAERKVRSLIDSKAKVKVVAPGITPYLRKLVSRKQITYVCKKFSDSDISNAFLVIGATDNSVVNKRISETALKKNILVNIIDVPELSSFYVPACVKRGDLIISISTSGKSPVLSSEIRRQLEKIYGPEYAKLTNILGKLRCEVKSKYPSRADKKKIWKRLVKSDVIKLIKAKKYKELKRLMERYI
jgi:precorrin-2 dehydrogenase/sirohydrochlorin ferrochelatase